MIGIGLSGDLKSAEVSTQKMVSQLVKHLVNYLQTATLFGISTCSVFRADSSTEWGRSLSGGYWRIELNVSIAHRHQTSQIFSPSTNSRRVFTAYSSVNASGNDIPPPFRVILASAIATMNH
jgi:hypothetical protein